MDPSETAMVQAYGVKLDYSDYPGGGFWRVRLNYFSGGC